MTRDLRQRCVTLAAAYGARVELIALEAPDPTEAHQVTWLDTR